MKVTSRSCYSPGPLAVVNGPLDTAEKGMFRRGFSRTRKVESNKFQQRHALVCAPTEIITVFLGVEFMLCSAVNR